MNVTRIKPREFPPVEQNIERPEKLSPSSLSKLDSCPRSFYFYGKYGGGAGSSAMASGSAWHLWAEKVLTHMRDSGLHQFEPDVGRDWMSAVLSDHKELVVPESFHDGLRQMCWNFCEAFYLEPSQVLSIEQMWEIRIGEWLVRGKIDLAELEGANMGRVRDWKTGFHLPSVDDVTKDFKSRFYCLLLAEGAPEGTERTAPLLNRVYSEQVFPRYTDSETGEMVSRGFEMDANAISDFKRSIELLLEKVEHGLESGEWPAQAGSHCSRCPSPKECPIPAHLNVNLPLSSEHEAQTAGALVLDLEKRKKVLDAAMKDWAKEEGSFMVGDLEFGFASQESRTLDKEALAQALQSDEPVDPSDLYVTRHSTRFGKRKGQ